MYQRVVNIKEHLQRHSVLLLGPRQTGKSTLLQSQFPEALYINLLEAETFRELSAFPEALRQRIGDQRKLIIVDEIQKLPALLDEVQLLIDRDRDLRFVLTGSSARKLRRGGANLLGGRATSVRFHPLVSPEVNFQRLEDRVSRGGLPAILDSAAPHQDLRTYVGTYLQEEIHAEGLTRSIGSFSRFLDVAGQCNTKQLNYSKVGNDAQVPSRTVKDYFQVLEDTLLGRTLPAFRKTRSRKTYAAEKFFFFDVGVANTLAHQERVLPGSEAFGVSLEHLVFLELSAYIDYALLPARLSFWRSLSNLEVDFLVDDRVAIEVKATGRISTNDMKGLAALAQDFPRTRKIFVCSEPAERTVNGVEVMHWDLFLRKLWGGEIVS